MSGDNYRQLFSEHFGYVSSNRKFKLGTPLVISGRIGNGKSALASALASWGIEQLEGLDGGKPVCVLTHYVGCSVHSKSHINFVRRSLVALKAAFAIEKVPEMHAHLSLFIIACNISELESND